MEIIFTSQFIIGLAVGLIIGTAIGAWLRKDEKKAELAEERRINAVLRGQHAQLRADLEGRAMEAWAKALLKDKSWTRN